MSALTEANVKSVAELTKQGVADRAIAAQLRISSNSVSAYRSMARARGLLPPLPRANAAQPAIPKSETILPPGPKSKPKPTPVPKPAAPAPKVELPSGANIGPAEPVPLFAIGDVVRLKSGGPLLTVTGIKIDADGDFTVEAWFSSEYGFHGIEADARVLQRA